MARWTPVTSGRRVQIPAYTDRWMMGDRYGEVHFQRLAKNTPDGDFPTTLYKVKLDVSGKTVTVVADDCTEV